MSYQELKNEYKNKIKSSKSIKHHLLITFSKELVNELQMSISDYLKVLDSVYKLPCKVRKRNSEIVSEFNSDTSTESVESNKRSISIFNKSKKGWKSYTSVMNLPFRHTNFRYSNVSNTTGIFGTKETSVYMTLSDNLCHNRTSSTQATASINKCFQVSNEWLPHSASTIATSTDYCSTCTVSTVPYHGHRQVASNIVNPNIYFFGRKKDERKQKGMGSKLSHTRLQKTSQTSSHAIKNDRRSSKSSVGSGSNTSVKQSQTVSKSKSWKASIASGTSKTVSIKDEKQLKPCPALGGTTKGDMMVTVSHIKIGPKETCPVHGNEPCQGPKCVLASSGEEQGPVKVTTVNNPRRGVFEIVIRKLSGAPLAKNELMLEWTPPPSRPPTCGGPCPIPCPPPGTFRPSKCKLIVCRTSTSKPKCCKKKPCGRTPCRPPPCTRCKKSPPCCGSPCKPCPPPSCCPPTPCGTSPCKSSPCLRPCPVGHKRQRRSRSQPKIKSHRKKVSPCCNRSKTCPVVRCRSVPDPCIGCCPAPPFCLPRKCCSTVPCKLPKVCASACSTCCG